MASSSAFFSWFNEERAWKGPCFAGKQEAAEMACSGVGIGATTYGMDLKFDGYSESAIALSYYSS